MKKIRVTYDILSIVLVLSWIGIYLFSKFASVDNLFNNMLPAYSVFLIVSYLYAFAIIGLAIYTYSKTSEHASLATTIIGCLILPFVVPILLYLFVIRRATKKL